MTASASGTSNEEFGYSVDIDDDTIVVGTSPATGTGKVYVFVRPDNGWAATTTPDATLTATGSAAGDGFGESVAITGDTITVGAQTRDYTDAQSNTIADAGAVYVFTKPTGGWVDGTQTAKLLVSDPVANGLFGKAVDVDSDTVAVGSPGAEEVYVFTKPSGGWADSISPGATLSPTNGQDGINSDGRCNWMATPSRWVRRSATSQVRPTCSPSKGLDGTRRSR